jgi:hypothetical protein
MKVNLASPAVVFAAAIYVDKKVHRTKNVLAVRNNLHDNYLDLPPMTLAVLMSTTEEVEPSGCST